MTILISLPSELQVIILTRWLQLKNVRNFDTALCNTFERLAFLKLISQPFCVFKYGWNCYVPPSLKWLAHRRLRVSGLVLGSAQMLDYGTRQKAMAVCGESVEEVNVHLFDTIGTNKMYIMFLNSAMLGDVATYCVNLTSFCIRITTMRPDHASEYDQAIERIIMSTKQLQSFEIGSGVLTAAVLTAICASHTLQKVSFNCCKVPETFTQRSEYITSITSGFNDNTHLFSCFPNLTTLHICKVPAEEAGVIAEYCVHLVNVYIFLRDVNGEYPSIPHDVVCKIATHWRQIINLELLGVRYNGLSDESIIVLVDQCTTLQRLNTNNHYHNIGCLQRTTYPINCTGPRLHTLSVFGDCNGSMEHICVKLSNSAYALQPIVDNVKLRYLVDTNVTTLVLHGFHTICDKQIAKLQHARLQHLAITSCAKVTSAGIFSLVPTLSQLTSLEIEKCSGFKHDIVAVVPALCPSLRKLVFYPPHSSYGANSAASKISNTLLSEKFPHVTTFDVKF